MCTIIALISLFLVSTLKVEKIYLYLYFLSFFLFSLSIDGQYFGFWNSMFVYDAIDINFEVYVYWWFYLVSFILYSVLLANTSKKDGINLKLTYLYSNLKATRLKKIGYMLAIFSITAGVLNLLRVGDYNLIFTDPREWERRFGQFFLLNYIYFLHTLAIVCIIVSCKLNEKVKFFDVLLIFLCVVSSTFHGIKFTVLHAFSFMIFTVLICNGMRIKKNVMIFSSVLLIFFICFFTFVRGGGIEGLVNYMTSASVNSIYEINTKDIVETGDLNNFFPFFDPAFYNKLISRVGGGEFISKGVSEDSGFYLNNKYNLTSTITKLSVAGPIGFVFWSCIYAFLLRFAYKLDTFFKLVLLVFLLHVLLMMFTAWEFYKYKLLFILFVSYFISRFIVTKRVK
ncbi:TPA: hypothetical protein NG565_002853 [Vibrio parahaemolyticus]|nr:hypothetical protein [Vibrio parahaemolyticus]